MLFSLLNMFPESARGEQVGCALRVLIAGTFCISERNVLA